MKGTPVTLDYEFHPLANIFPLIDGQAYQDLMVDVMRNGVREPIWLYEDMILDGRNRYRAAKAMGVECPVRTYDGQDATGFVVSLNLHRRHLSESQRAMVAAKLANMKQGQRTDVEPSANLQKVSQSDAASLLNVSPRSVASAREVINEAPPEVVKAVESGYMSVNLATQVAALPEEDKAEIAAAPTEEIVDVARDAVRNHRAIGTGENEWYTPVDYVNLARAVMGGIDLDPASCDEAQEVVQASSYYTKESNGLLQDWRGRVWMNPPYSRDLMPSFIDKMVKSYLDGDVTEAVVLTHNNTDTQWFHALAGVSRAMCFNKRRIKFYRGDSALASPTNGQTFFYLGDNIEKFAEMFGDIGIVVEPV